MKIILGLAALILAANGLSVEEEWISFKEIHNKIYKNIIEEKRRFEIFETNLNIIREHNKKYENGESSYYMGVNKFTDLTEEEFGVRFSKAPQSKSQSKAITIDIPEGVKVPNAIDWRDNHAVLTDVGDQGDSCSAGYAFATTDAVAAQFVISKNQSVIPLSKQEIVDCSVEFGNSGCKYGLVYSALRYVAAKGLTSEEFYPYEEQESGTCKKTDNDTVITIKHISNRVAGAEEAGTYLVSTYGPTAVTIYGNPLIQHYKGGIFDDASKCPNDESLVNHGILIAGYGSEGEQDYWILKNSWGETWGENGFMRLKRNPSICGVLLDLFYIIM